MYYELWEHKITHDREAVQLDDDGTILGVKAVVLAYREDLPALTYYPPFPNDEYLRSGLWTVVLRNDPRPQADPPEWTQDRLTRTERNTLGESDAS